MCFKKSQTPQMSMLGCIFLLIPAMLTSMEVGLSALLMKSESLLFAPLHEPEQITEACRLLAPYFTFQWPLGPCLFSVAKPFFNSDVFLAYQQTYRRRPEQQAVQTPLAERPHEVSVPKSLSTSSVPECGRADDPEEGQKLPPPVHAAEAHQVCVCVGGGGVKVFAVCDVTSSYLVDFNIYTGAFQGQTATGLMHAVVVNLTADNQHAGHVVFTDNFYTSPTLADTSLAAGTHLVGTLRVN